MSDTTTITPEERARLREQADKSYLLPLDEDEVPSVGFDGLTDDRIAYIAAACNSVPRLLNALEAAEAESARLRAERDWLAENAVDRPCAYDSCPFGLHRPTGPDDDDCDKTRAQCWTKAARRAVAAGEGE